MATVGKKRDYTEYYGFSFLSNHSVPCNTFIGDTKITLYKLWERQMKTYLHFS